MSKTRDIYVDYMQKTGDRSALYRRIAKHYNVHSALYPGSHVDITPSFFIPQVTYIDNFKGTVRFFKALDAIRKYIEANKTYDTSAEIAFIASDYTASLDIGPFDLLISQYAGFVGQSTKKYLKSGGILLCNDSHGDATLAQLDPDYQLVGTVTLSGDISTDALDTWFRLPKDRAIDVEAVRSKMKGPRYRHQADNYLFLKR